MKNTFHLILLFLISLVATSHADTKTWVGGGGDNLWKTDANWSPSGAPVGGDTVNISNGDTVDTTGIGSFDFTPPNLTVNVTGNSTVTAAGVIRYNGGTWNVASGSHIVAASTRITAPPSTSRTVL